MSTKTKWRILEVDLFLCTLHNDLTFWPNIVFKLNQGKGDWATVKGSHCKSFPTFEEKSHPFGTSIF